jgi:hypothetical protein
MLIFIPPYSANGTRESSIDTNCQIDILPVTEEGNSCQIVDKQNDMLCHKTYPVSPLSPSVHMFEEMAEPVPIHTKRSVARNSAASCLKVQSCAMVDVWSIIISY